MARNFNFAPAPTNNTRGAFKKADAFINLYLPTKTGGRKQVGAIALHGDNPFHAQIINRLKQDDELAAMANLKAFLEAIELSFVAVSTEEGADELVF